jgi:anti-anti-sigma factor
MEIQPTERDDGITQVALVGRLDMLGLHQIELKFQGYTAARRMPTIVDLSKLDLITSLGLGMLIAAFKALDRCGAKMVLLNPLGMVDLVLRTAKIEEIIPVVATLEEAVARVRPA